MKFENTIKVLAATALLASAISCSENEWEPGPDVNPDCMSVYFGQLSTYDMIVEPDDSRLIPVTVGRITADNAATVEIAVNSCPEGVVVPSSVSFAAGEQSTTLYIDITNMPSKTSGTVDIALPENMVSPYTEGTHEINLKITVSGKWEVFAKDASIVFNSTFPEMKTDILNLDGTQNFRLPDFLGSGVNFTFRFSDPAAGDYSFVPISGFEDVHDYYGASYEYDGWFLYDEETGGHPSWSPDGVTYIADMEFDSDYSYGYYSDGYLMFDAWTTFADGSGAYIDAYIYFEPLYDPFAATE